MTILDQLVDFYYKYEGFHKTRLHDTDIRAYFKAMASDGRLIICNDGDKLLGYCDFSKLNYDQFGYLILSDRVSPELHSDNGAIVFVNTVCVDPAHRELGVVKYLKNKLELLNPDAQYICGKRQGKRYKPIVIFKRNNSKVRKNGNVKI